METAIDVTLGERKLDTRPGKITPTGRDLDVAVAGRRIPRRSRPPQGERYTRNGHLMRTLDGTLTTREGSAVIGDDGPIKLEEGEIAIENDGTVRAGKEVAGKLAVVRFENPGVAAS